MVTSARQPLQAGWGGPPRWLTLDNATLGLLAAVLAYPALAFGGVEGASQFVLAILVTLLTLLTLGRWLFDRQFGLQPTLMWIPLGLIILLAAVQLVPLPQGVVGALSPARIEAYEPLLSSDKTPEWLPLTSSEYDTRHSLRLAVVGLLVLGAVTSYLRDKTHLQHLLIAVFAIGCFEAAIAIAQIVTGADKLYWNIDAGQGGMLSAGSFVNHSHFSQFVNLAIGAGVGLLLMRLQHAERRRGHFEGAFRVSAREVMASQGWILAGLALCAFGVCLSLSRNGILSLVIALAITGCLLARQKQLGWQGWLLSLVPLLVFALLLLFGLNVFYERLATLEEGHHYADRWALTLASFKAGWDYLLLGAGMGAYSLVFPAFDNTGSASVAAYADNDYAQLFVEAGLAGMVLLAVVVSIIVYYLLKLRRHSNSSTAQVAYGLLVGFIAIAIHSATDFGQRLPGVFLVTLTMVGTLSVLPAVIARSQRKEAHRGRQDSDSRGGQWVTKSLVAVVVLTACGYILLGSYDHYQADGWWATAYERESRLRGDDWDGTDQDYQDLLLAAENSVAWEPDNAVMRYWLNFYRWMSINRSETVEGVMGDLEPEWREVFDRLVEELATVRGMVPTFAPAYLLEGQLRGYVLGQTEAGGQLLERASQLAIGDPQVQFVFGQWAAQQGQKQLAQSHLQRAVEIDKRFFQGAATLMVVHLDDLAIAREWAGHDLSRLNGLASILADMPEHEIALAEIRDLADQVLAKLADDGRATASQLMHLGDKAAKEGKHEDAIGYYRKALGKQFTLTQARLSLARSLRALGRLDEALEEARICMRQSNSPQARTLAEELALEVGSTQNAPPK